MIKASIFHVAAAVLPVCVSAGEIVLPANPLAVERYAAAELAYHVERATGKKLKTVYEDEAPAVSSRRRYYVGATEAARRLGLTDRPFEPDEHQVRSHGRDLYFLGGDKDGRTIHSFWSATAHGTMYAVYEFLEKRMGVKWLWPGPEGEVIPEMKEVPGGPVDIRRKERLSIRRFGIGEARHEYGCVGWNKLANRELHDIEKAKFFLRHRNGISYFTPSGHAFSKWWQKHGKSRPGFFQEKLDGTRGPYTESEAKYVPMCVSSPAFHEAVVADWLGNGYHDPEGEHYEPVISCRENDSPGMCLCRNCRAWDVEDGRFAKSDFWSRRIKTITRREYWEQLACVMWGESEGVPATFEPASVSDRYVRFYNSVLEVARRHRPSAKVAGYAYANYLEPPKKTRVADGVVIEYVPRMFFPYTKENSNLFRKWWSGWRAAGAKEMIYRPNYTLAGANLPLNQARVIASDIAYAAANGMTGASFSQIGAWSAHAVMNYTIFRTLRAPDIGYERALSEFCSAFGAAADDIRAYCAHIETVGRGLHPTQYQQMTLANPTVRGGPGGGNCTFMLIAGDIYSEKFFTEARTMLGSAARKASGDPVVSARVRFLADGLQESYLTYRARVVHKSGDRKAFTAAFGKLQRFRAGTEDRHICDYSVHCRNEGYAAGWKHDRKSTRGPQPELVKLVEAGKLKEARASWWGYDPENSTRFLQAAIDSGV
ncbi:MAG: DUF4838 domain-containing protein, partial [Kiritimatiellae bacterium]|nr:DUF4838 domain-containing protein [Kiritimatiellia bacterium]